MLGVRELLCIHMNCSLAQPHVWNGEHDRIFSCCSGTLPYHQLFFLPRVSSIPSTPVKPPQHLDILTSSKIFKYNRIFSSHASPGFSFVALLPFTNRILDKYSVFTISTALPCISSQTGFWSHILLYLLRDSGHQWLKPNGLFLMLCHWPLAGTCLVTTLFFINILLWLLKYLPHLKLFLRSLFPSSNIP